jgi:transforming growth factor-beta-induced protein
VRIDGAKVIKADIITSNGIIHVIDTVMLPRADIVDTAVGAGSFTTLVAAVKAAQLVETLKGKGPFTVFAPTDDAFAKLPDGTVAALLKDKAKLQAILTYHVVSGRVLSEAIAEGETEVKTVAGGTLKIMRDENGVTVNGAKVIKADIITGNGIIHVVDGVLLP